MDKHDVVPVAALGHSLTRLGLTLALMAACAGPCADVFAASVTAIVDATVLHPELEGAAAL